MMKLVINIVLVLLILFAGYLLYSSIQEPIKFSDIKNKREAAVIDRLIDIRTSQEMYRAIKDSYADNFNTLTNTLKSDSIPFPKIIGDRDVTGQDYQIDTFYRSAIDSIQGLGIELDSLKYIPYSGGKVFQILYDTIEYQKIDVYVLEVSAVRKDFMGEYGDRKFARYDQSYEPESRIKFGDMNKPNLGGNWE